MKINIPPIKCQGIKSKLVPFIEKNIFWSKKGKWIEPFMGSGVVGFNLAPYDALFCDTNPHLINFYNSIKSNVINRETVKEFLSYEGELLRLKGESHFYDIRARFNETGSSFDFLFLNRSCFNGLMRFNRKGKFNVPFCRKDNRFSQSYITKITNQIDFVSKKLIFNNWEFKCLDYKESLNLANKDDFIYLDPPYIDRFSDYFDSWGEEKERILFENLKVTEAKFLLSTWEENSFRRNEYIDRFWCNFNRLNHAHFYHLGGKETNRHEMFESIVFNYETVAQLEKLDKTYQFSLHL